MAGVTQASILGRGQILKITRRPNGKEVFELSGRMDVENSAELKTLFNSEANSRHIVLDLKDLTLADQDVVITSEALRSGQHEAQELPSIHPRMDRETRTWKRLSRAKV